MEERKHTTSSLLYALKSTIPVLTGYAVLGFAYGLLMQNAGFNAFYTILICLSVFSGAAQYVLVPILLKDFDPLNTALIMILLGARHIFYSIAMLDKYKNTGKYKFFLIFGLSDETFSLNYSTELPGSIKTDKYYFFVTILDQAYWLIASVLGTLFGNLMHFDLTGLDFVMTAMFTVIFLNQWMTEENHFSSILGVVISLTSLIVLNIFNASDYFIVVSMILILLVLTLLRKKLSIKKDTSYRVVNCDLLTKEGN